MDRMGTLTWPHRSPGIVLDDHTLRARTNLFDQKNVAKSMFAIKKIANEDSITRTHIMISLKWLESLW